MENDWYFSLSNDLDSYEPFDDSTFKLLPRYLPGREGIIYLKTSFKVPEYYQEQMIALYLGRIEIADQVYLNGNLIGETGRFPPDWYNDWNMDRRYMIPPAMISFDIENELLLKIYVNKTGLIDGEIQIGPECQIEKIYSLKSLLHRQINMLFSFLLLVFGLNYLFLFLKRKKDKEIIWFSLLSILFAISQAGIYMSSIPGFQYSLISYVPFMKTIGILEILVVYCFIQFTYSYFHLKIVNLTRLYILVPSFILMIIYLIQVDYAEFSTYYNLFEMSLSIPSIYIIYLVISAHKNKVREAGIFIIFLIPAAMLFLHDMILTNVIEGYLLMLGGLGLPFLLIMINILFGSDLVNDRNKAENLNLVLDDTIIRHKKDLEITSQKLSYTTRRDNFIDAFKLSAREREILSLIIDGQSNDEIAETLVISPRTVSAHIYKIYKKINLHSRTEIFASFNIK